MQVSGHLHDTAALPPGEDYRLLIEQEAEWAADPVWKLVSCEPSVPDCDISGNS
jgi:hypothetical protein